ncbi:hypothetical protein LOK49_LG01G00998 [Camellia lanceoleosa]|uniref:Uncharacterized protein n=1 Tax=Camellia lanceoleosa TaxID=1840588 RepID=A0ACC0IWK3_9ERIC|nr:hypothetical protein LOK49_LG01G00998 [Camellia lanceoleosa]
MNIQEKAAAGHLPNIFRSLGRLLLESFVKKFILELKSYGADIGAENTSNFIYNYAISMPNLALCLSPLLLSWHPPDSFPTTSRSGSTSHGSVSADLSFFNNGASLSSKYQSII